MLRGGSLNLSLSTHVRGRLHSTVLIEVCRIEARSGWNHLDSCLVRLYFSAILKIGDA